MAKDDVQEALVNFAEQVYQASEEYGPTHRRTALGYCNMGRLFHYTKDYVTSNSLFRQVVTIWTEFVDPILDEMTAESSVPKIPGMKKETTVWIQGSDKFEAEDSLMYCYYNQKECMRIPGQCFVTALDLANTCYALSVLFYIWKRLQEADKQAAEGLQYLEDKQIHDPVFVKKFNKVMKLATKSAHWEPDIQ
ncbi:zinc finger MYND domain-containing protein 12 [Elysia marginata]|uniref:Zinc finger MYND domain-containing protein 12 n=1 Tax=Elysia marginata TaxID=1093978 RepID=A0AAV4JJP8_9GAST|nr:zinc finger MYND domain-containing protein 12 [Elysia marginata]